jgi:hypothetical protein
VRGLGAGVGVEEGEGVVDGEAELGGADVVAALAGEECVEGGGVEGVDAGEVGGEVAEGGVEGDEGEAVGLVELAEEVAQEAGLGGELGCRGGRPLRGGAVVSWRTTQRRGVCWEVWAGLGGRGPSGSRRRGRPWWRR